MISGVITREDWRGKGVGTLAVRKLCYDLLKEGLGVELPWGTLTGIRPTKIPMKLMEEGYKKGIEAVELILQDEIDAAMNQFNKKVLVKE